MEHEEAMEVHDPSSKGCVFDTQLIAELSDELRALHALAVLALEVHPIETGRRAQLKLLQIPIPPHAFSCAPLSVVTKRRGNAYV